MEKIEFMEYPWTARIPLLPSAVCYLFTKGTVSCLLQTSNSFLHLFFIDLFLIDCCSIIFLFRAYETSLLVDQEISSEIPYNGTCNYIKL